MLVKPITISDKGQIAIPKRIMEHLGSKVIKLEIADNNEVRMYPIQDVAGSLSDFAKQDVLDDCADIRKHPDPILEEQKSRDK